MNTDGITVLGIIIFLVVFAIIYGIIKWGTARKSRNTKVHIDMGPTGVNQKEQKSRI